MTQTQEIHQLQSNLSNFFDRIGITQELKMKETYDEFSSVEIDKISLLIEKFQYLIGQLKNEGPIPFGTLDHRLLVCLGNYSCSIENNDQALEWYNLSNIIEENEWAYYNSAKIHIYYEKLDLGYQSFDQAIKLKPDFLKAYLGQAKILIRQENKEKALSKLLQGQKINPNDQNINKLLAQLHIEKGEKEEALTNLKAIHYKDQDVNEKISDLESQNSVTGRFKKIFRRN